MIWKLVQISGHSASFSNFWQSPSSLTSHQQPLVSWKFWFLVLLFKTRSYLSQSLTYMIYAYMCMYIYILVWFLWYYQQKQFWFSLRYLELDFSQTFHTITRWDCYAYHPDKRPMLICICIQFIITKMRFHYKWNHTNLRIRE